mmetsp:Transcript_133307/g.414516  ORF Transcript_133307/g.414516 Transcript_133307/m.414516 type:complete len:341 (-) Transcript_133307:52-1074(-)|eukprot:CAMPEP_0204584276 /NCGR_PEP_ID=MMETSP0661-20131031/46249_1 /ASSEMBLY_ACC=CAM_ASM_000606 /TAXON_ID=109239 /ORGANISM="Alexandrium margalefi, Strain AMGDE01CS-322" /LENGTH=340 /DNA_ID=CAMNT_0051593711 /DNA_START=78 /DNA_END=1100 /DNA_ORIENTATION=+
MGLKQEDEDEHYRLETGHESLSADEKRSAEVSELGWTVAGCVGLCFWASSFAASRIVSQTIGTFTSMAVAFIGGGTAANCVMALFGRFRQQLRCPPTYWLLCGIPFTGYPFFLYLSFAQAKDDAEIVLLTLINYFWPQVMSVLGIVFLRQEWKLTLVPAILGAVTCVAVMQFKPGMGPLELAGSFVAIWPAALAALLASFCWASYSVAAKHFAKQGVPSAVPLLTISGGLACLAGRFIVGEESPVPLQQALADPRFVLWLLYFSAVPACFCRFAWDAACRRGRMPVLTAFAYLNPLLATVLNLLLLGVPPSAAAVGGSAGLVLCSVLASRSVGEPQSGAK